MNPRDEAVWRLAGWVAGLLDLRGNDTDNDTQLLNKLASYYDHLGRPGDVLVPSATKAGAR